MKSKLFFDHIPKTAGTSINSVFKLFFPSYETHYSFISYRDLLELNKSEYIGGHIFYNYEDKLSVAHFHCTVIRDPIDRLKSEFLYFNKIAINLLKKNLISDEVLKDYRVLNSFISNFDEYCSNKNFVKTYLGNTQCRHFAARIVENPNELDDKSLLEAAILSINDYDLIGSFEQLQLFSDNIAKYFGVQPRMLPWMNQSTTYEQQNFQISDQTYNTLALHNIADYNLLKWLNENLQLNFQMPKIELIRTKSINKIISEKHESAKNNDMSEIGTGNKKIKFSSFKFSKEKFDIGYYRSHENIELLVQIESVIDVSQLTLGIAVYDSEGNLAYGTNSLLVNSAINIKFPGRYKGSILLENKFSFGCYTITLALHEGLIHTNSNYHWMDKFSSFVVCDFEKFYYGYLDCNAVFEISDESEDLY